MGATGTHGGPDTRLLEQVIHCELHQYVVPETRAVHPVGGERLRGAMFQRRQGLVGQRGAPVGEPPSSRPLLALPAAQLTPLSA
jgi:hypothetical protein